MERIQQRRCALFWGAALLLCMIVCLTGCSVKTKPAESRESYTVTDARGRQVSFSHKPMRIIGTSGSVDTMLLGVTEPSRLVAVSDVSRDPSISYVSDMVKDVPVTIPLSGASMETLTRLNPDLIVASTYTDGQDLALFEQLGYPVIILQGPQSLEEVKQDVRILAAAVGEPSRGEKVVAEMDRHLHEIDAVLSARTDPKPVALLVSQMSRYGGPGSMFHELLTRARIDSAFAKAGVANGQIFSQELIVQTDPDFFIVSADRTSDSTGAGKFRDSFLANPAISRLRAAQHVKELPDRYIYAASQNAVYAVKALANAAYGPLFDLSDEKQIKGY